MATGQAQGRDYTNQRDDDWTEAPGASRGDDIPFGNDDEDELVIADTVAPADADQTVQAQKGFSEIPSGTHELVITGKLNSGTDTYVNATVKDPKTGAERTIGYTTKKVTLKISLAGDPKASLLFDVFMPPTSGDPEHILAYWHGVPKGGKAQGWHAHTFRLIVDKAIAPWPQGQPMPPMARSMSNWWGRRFIGTIDPPESYQDKNTGETKPGKSKLNPRSFRPAPGQPPLTGLPRPGNGGGLGTGPAAGTTAQQPARQPAPQQRQVAPATTPTAASDYKNWPM